MRIVLLLRCGAWSILNIDNGKQEEEITISDESSWDRENKSFQVVSTQEEEVIEEKSIITLEEKEKMISNDVQGEEDLRFISLLFKFPKLFIIDYSQIRGEGIKHHIKLEHLKFVSPIVVVLNEKDINFKPLIDSTKQDQFLLSFRDDKLDEMVVHKKQGNVENVVCQEEIYVDEAKIDVIQKVTTPTRLEALKVFVRKIRSLERFIHMLTCLLLSRVMYPMALLVFGALMKI